MEKKLYREIIVSYDIEDNRKRKKFADFLKDVGLQRIQKSVFWGYVNMAEQRSICRAFGEQLSKETDFAFAVPVRLREHIKETGFGHQTQQFRELKDHEII